MLHKSFNLATDVRSAAKTPVDKDTQVPKGEHDGSRPSAGSGKKPGNQKPPKEETVTSILDRVDPDFPYDLPI